MQKYLYKTYNGKKVLITGDTGFKGSWLAIWLKQLGAEVYGYSLPPQRKEDNFVRCKLNEKIHHLDGDIRDLNKLKNYFEEVQPEFAFHLAAQPIVLESYENPHYTFETNVMGTVNLLEAIRGTPTIKSAVFITSDKVYENDNQILGYKENDKIWGKEPYSASKACDEIIIKSYADSFFSGNDLCNIATARAGNIIGGGDWGNYRIIPDFFRAINNNKKLEIRNPNYIRPWQYLLEPLSGYLLLALKLLESKDYCGSWNFGPSSKKNLTVLELIQKVIEYYGAGEFLIDQNKSELSESGILNLDITKAIEKLNWNPILDIEQAIEFTVAGYNEENIEGNVLNSRIKQIEKYLSLSGYSV